MSQKRIATRLTVTDFMISDNSLDRPHRKRFRDTSDVRSDQTIPVSDPTPSKKARFQPSPVDDPQIKALNRRDQHGLTAILRALGRKDTAAVVWFLEKGADPDIADTKQNTPLHMAVSQNCPSVISPLVSHGANINARNHLGNTPLMEAVMAGENNLVRTLLKQGADPDMTNRNGETPLHVAVKNQNESVVSALLSYPVRLQLDGDNVTPMDVAKHFHYSDIQHQLATQLSPKDQLLAAVLEKLTNLAQLFAVGGMFSIDGLSKELQGQYHSLVLTDFIKLLNDCQAALTDPADKQVLRRILPVYEKSLEIAQAADPVSMIQQEIAAAPVTVYHSGWNGHATYAVLLNNHAAFPGKQLLAYVNRGDGSENHTHIHKKRDSCFTLALPDQKSMKKVIRELNQTSELPSRLSKYVVYARNPRLYKAFKSPLIKTVQSSQNQGNCTGSSLKATLKLLCQLETGDPKKGEQLFDRLADQIKARQFVELMILAEQFDRAYSVPGAWTVTDKVMALFTPKWQHRFEKGNHPQDGSLLTRVARQVLKAHPEAVETRSRIARLVAGLSNKPEAPDAEPLKTDGVKTVRNMKDPNLPDHKGLSPLHRAVMKNKFAAVDELLNRSDIQLDVRDQNGNTPLHLAAEKGNVKIITRLLRQPGIEPDLKNHNHETPLHLAAEKGHEKAVRALLATQAVDLGARDLYNRTPIYRAVDSGVWNDRIKQTIIRLSAADPEAQNLPADEDRSLMHAAAEYGETELIDLLLSLKVPGNPEDCEGLTPFHYALFMENFGTASHLKTAVPGTGSHHPDRFVNELLSELEAFRAESEMQID